MPRDVCLQIIYAQVTKPGVGWRTRSVSCAHSPSSHAASRRDSSPFRGAEGWAEVCGVYASVCRDADTVVFLPPVRGGVLDAPWSRDCRGGVVANIGCGLLHPRHLRCAHLRLPLHISYSAGAARAPFRRANQRYPFTHAGRASSPARRGCGVCERTGLRTGPFCALTRLRVFYARLPVAVIVSSSVPP